MKTCLLFCLLYLSSVITTFAVPISENHPSAYLQLHANDAVNWQLLDDSVLQQARKNNQLIFYPVVLVPATGAM